MASLGHGKSSGFHKALWQASNSLHFLDLTSCQFSKLSRAFLDQSLAHAVGAIGSMAFVSSESVTFASER